MVFVLQIVTDCKNYERYNIIFDLKNAVNKTSD